MWRHFELTSGNQRLVCWLKDDKRLHVGRRLSLKDDIRVWTVTARYTTTLPAQPLKEWRVGGLL